MSINTFRDLVTEQIVFASNHVATQAVTDALPYCTAPSIPLAVEGVNVNITTHRNQKTERP
jgi:hypothetical protein